MHLQKNHGSCAAYQVILRLGHVGIVRPQLRLVDLQGPLVVILHLLVLALVLAQQSQVI